MYATWVTFSVTFSTFPKSFCVFSLLWSIFGLSCVSARFFFHRDGAVFLAMCSAGSNFLSVRGPRDLGPRDQGPGAKGPGTRARGPNNTK